MVDSVQSVLHVVVPRRAAVIGVLAALAVGLFVVAGAGPRPQRPDASGLQSLPLTARAPIAAALGAVDRGYFVRGLAASNPAQRLQARFASDGVTVASGAGRASLSLEAYGRRGALAQPGRARPRTSANRVTYARGPLREWYANGPLGVEQGFDLAARPRAGSGPLTFAMSVGGDLAPRLAHGAIVLAGRGVRLRYGELVATDARGRALPARLGLSGDRLLISVDDRGALYPLRIDPLIQQADMTASDGAGLDELGSSVAVSGNTIVAGAPLHTVGANNKQGAAYVFVEPPGGWADTSAPSAELTASDGAPNDIFGVSVAISGSTVVVGASGHNSSQGAAYVFAMPASGWAGALHESAELTAFGGEAGDLFGDSIAASGNVIVAGSPARTVGANEHQGRAYVFVQPAAGWSGPLTQSARLDASDGVKDEEFGHSVAIDGGTIAVGADNGNAGKGAAYVFTMPPAGWSGPATENAELRASGGEAGDELGYSIAISGATVVAGAAGRHSSQGAAYVFTMPPAGWSGTVHDSAQLTAASDEETDEIGLSVAVLGSNVVVGAPGRNGGTALLFTMPFGGWAGVLQASSEFVAAGASGTGLGGGVAMFGQTVVGGAPARTVGSNALQGSVYVFAPPGPTSSIVAPANGAVYTQGQSVTAAYACSATSPATLAGCIGSVANGAAIDTQLPGGHTFTATATDSEGFRTTQTVAYNVVASATSAASPPAPTLSHVAQSHKTWRRGGKLAALARAKTRRKPPLGTTFSFTLSTAAKVRLTFTQELIGRRVGRKCIARTDHNKHRRRCRRTVTAGALSLPTVAAGNRRISFQGRLSRNKTLEPGRYSVTIAATNAGGHTSAKAMAFTIVR